MPDLECDRAAIGRDGLGDAQRDIGGGCAEHGGGDRCGRGGLGGRGGEDEGGGAGGVGRCRIVPAGGQLDPNLEGGTRRAGHHSAIFCHPALH